MRFGTSGPAHPVGTCNRRKKKRKKGRGRHTKVSQIHWLHATGSSMPVMSLWVKEGGWPRTETVGGTRVGDARDVGAGCCRCHQDLATAWLVLAKQGRGRVRTVFGCVSRECTNAHNWEKKKRTKKNEKRKEKKENQTHCLYISFMPLAV